jgi:quercetin dioxygenase-like cupin family protein
MARLFEILSHHDQRGSLHVLQEQLPFAIRRVYYIHFANQSVRGGHRHHHSDQVLICLSGRCMIYTNNGIHPEEILLDNPAKALFVAREDWHTMTALSENTILLVLANTPYDVNDYIDAPYPNN